jgi:hypothetical protein
MRLTHEQAKALGPAAREVVERIEREEVHASLTERELLGDEPPRERKSPGDGMNKTEQAFAELLDTRYDVIKWWREPIKLRLGGRTFYTPDFLVEPAGWNWPVLAFVEVKGFMRDDAAVKLKVAASAYPCFRWLLVVRAGRHGWEVREVDSRGIGREPVRVEWIGGGA